MKLLGVVFRNWALRLEALIKERLDHLGGDQNEDSRD